MPVADGSRELVLDVGASPPPRFRGLDGLRGLAALVVLVCHCLLVQPELAVPYFPGTRRSTGWAAAFTYSPLHLLWAGSEAVIVFFVLSGFVLSVGPASGKGTDWRGYYPRRLVRLYLPTAVAVLVALPQARFLRPRVARATDSLWLGMHAGGGGVRAALRDMLLVLHPGATLTPIWSLQWEVAFSALLPAYLVVLRYRRPMAAASLGLLAATLCGLGAASGVRGMTYLPVFLLGVLVAQHRVRLTALARRHGTLLLVLGCLTFAGYWMAAGQSSRAGALAPVPFGAEVVGAMLVVVAFLDGPACRAASSSAAVQWLGKRSFSLYLVHEPIVVTVAYALGGRPAIWAELGLAVPLSLVAAEAFGRLVESPSLRLAQVAARASRWSRRTSPGVGIRAAADLEHSPHAESEHVSAPR